MIVIVDVHRRLVTPAIGLRIDHSAELVEIRDGWLLAWST